MIIFPFDPSHANKRVFFIKMVLLNLLPGEAILIFILNKDLSHVVWHVVFEIYIYWWCYCICHVVVSRALGNILFRQEQYEEALQMYEKAHDILMKVSPKPEEMATGRH